MKEYMDNRELSWLKFNDRVLKQANDNMVPLAEKMNFVSIYQTNLDEFFRVRLGFLYDQMLFYPAMIDNKSEMTAEEQLKACFTKIRRLNHKKDSYYQKIMNELLEYNVKLDTFDEIDNKDDKRLLENYFEREILPLLSPLVVSKRTPFPFMNNGELFIAAQLTSHKGKRKLGIVSLANVMDERLMELPVTRSHYILVEELVASQLSKLFKKYKVEKSSVIRCTRSADIDEDDIIEGNSYREIMEKLIKERRHLHPVRLEYTEGLEDIEISMITKFLDLDERQAFISASPLDFSFFGKLRDVLKIAHPELFYTPLPPKKSPLVNDKKPMLEQVMNHDIMLAYPYNSMDSFLRMLDEAAVDERVVSIKMTLYRVAKNSRVVNALIKAAENGKEVIVLVELRARFDEENNIGQSKALEKAGCTVIYGLEGYKVHSKLCLITLKEDHIQYISQIGTGNYNEKTSKFYTDLSLMTARNEIGEEVNDIFTHLLQGETEHHTNYLFVSPHCMLDHIFKKIDEQIALAKEGKDAYVGFKCNSVTSKPMIEKLIEASQAGVHIDMVVRGICCIVPGVKDYTDRIRVISIVGRYLEHSRIYIFGRTSPDVYISSADLMTRNLERRVEVAAPLLDERIRNQVITMFNAYFKDNVKACELLSDRSYKRVKNKEPKFNVQEYFLK